MRKSPNEKIEPYRTSGPSNENYGAFQMSFRGQWLRVVASCGLGWDHVSVSRPDRTPTWDEMCFVKSQFFYGDEAVMQLHPPEASYVNNHRYCLHLWRPQTQEEIESNGDFFRKHGEVAPKLLAEAPIPLPPEFMVGIK